MDCRTLRFCRPLWLLSLAALFVGCKSNDNLALLEAENRRLEDRVFQLESDLCQHCDLLDSLEAENLSLRGGSKSSNRDNDGYSGDIEDNGRPPRIDLGTPETDVDDTGPAPRFDGGAAPKLPRGDRPQRLFPVGLGGPAPSTADLMRMRAASAEVTRITLDRLSAGGAADGLAVVVEPRDGAGQLVKATGDISVVVLDGSRPDDAARLARWDFTPAEAASHFRRTALGERMHLVLTWPDAPPPGSDLRLFVRFSTSDGRKLIADVPIESPAAPMLKASAGPIVAAHEVDAQSKTESETESEANAAADANAAAEANDAVEPNDADDDEVQPFPTATPDDEERPLTTRRPRRKPTWSPYR